MVEQMPPKHLVWVRFLQDLQWVSGVIATPYTSFLTQYLCKLYLLGILIALSSNGRTAEFGSANRGSSPCEATMRLVVETLNAFL